MKRILIATDGSDPSGRAVRHGLQLAKHTGAEAIVLRVSGKPAHIVVLGVDLTELPDSVKAEIKRHIDQHFAWVKQVADEVGVSCETLRIEADHPWEGILEVARQRGVDLVVMASHGRKGRVHRMIGSETMKVLTAARMPVLVLT